MLCRVQHCLLVCCITACWLPWLAQRKTKPCGTQPALHCIPNPFPPRQVDNWQIISPDGRLENRVQLLPGLRVRALAEAGPEPAPGGGMRTGVAIEEVRPLPCWQLTPLTELWCSGMA